MTNEKKPTTVRLKRKLSAQSNARAEVLSKLTAETNNQQLITKNQQLTTNNQQPHLTDAIIDRAERELLTPDRFYNLCRQVSQLQPQSRLYFLPKDLEQNFNLRINPYQLCLLFDRLARYVREQNRLGASKKLYWQKALIYNLGRRTPIFFLWQKRYFHNHKRARKNLEISLEIAGFGMVGRVARVSIDRGENLALKVFFDPDFVWQHGPWGEIPVSIYLKAHQVIKDLPEFKFASQDWAVWEWIYPQTNPQTRLGITYDQFARQEGLTRLNTLNLSNYNPYQIRWDIGGIQKEYLGRRFIDFGKGTIFYLRKARREGVFSLTKYITWQNIIYVCQRIFAIIFPKTNNYPHPAPFAQGVEREITNNK